MSLSHVLSLGAINKQTRAYVYPKIANKKDAYICPECSKDLIPCQGKIKAPYFRHKVDNVKPCHHYSSPLEIAIHDDAEKLMVTLLQQRTPISFARKCDCCPHEDVYEIPEMTAGSSAVMEHRFQYNGLKVADVAYLDDGEIFCIFEIYKTHRTLSENRPEPWFEIDAVTLITLANDVDITALKIPCIRGGKCDRCVAKENEEKRRIAAVVAAQESAQMMARLSHPTPQVLVQKQPQTPAKKRAPSPPQKTAPVLTLALRRAIQKYHIYYKHKNYCCNTFQYTAEFLKFVKHCDDIIRNEVRQSESIYNQEEIDKNLFEKCYYSKYDHDIKSIDLYGANWARNDGPSWVNNYNEQTMRRFLEHYRLINPMNIAHHFEATFAK